MARVMLLSLHQPWATLLSLGIKTIETRSWDTRERGWLAIHAAKHWNQEAVDLCRILPEFRNALNGAGFDVDTWTRRTTELPLGAIVGIGRLTGCFSTHGDGQIGSRQGFIKVSEADRAFGNFEKGRFGWFFENLQVLPEPIPWVGPRGLVTVDVPGIEDYLIR